MATLGFFTVVYADPRNLNELLEIVTPAGFDQIVVVHDGPDTTGCGLAKRYTDNAIATPYRQGWAHPVYQIAMQLMTTDWVFHLDVDERPHPDLLEMLPCLVEQAGQEIDAWEFERLEASGEVTSQYRLLRRGAAYYIDIMHTQAQGIAPDRLQRAPPLLPGGYHILHNTDPADLARAGKPGGDLDALREKKHRYTRIQAALTLKYCVYHPDLLKPGKALGIDYDE